MNNKVKLLIAMSTLFMGLTQCNKEKKEEPSDYPVLITEDNAEEEASKLLKEIDSL